MSQIIFKEVAEVVENLEVSLSNIYKIILTIINQLNFWVALSFYILSAMFWIFGLKRIAISKAFAMTSLNFVIISIYSFLIFKEDLSLSKILSSFFIVIGVLAISQSEELNNFFSVNSKK